MFRVNHKNNGTFIVNFKHVIPFSSVSTDDFEHVNVSGVIATNIN